ncbi:MAG: shikimate dehydrogenase [Chloroflexi bacterium]|nr:shikimate dehydrogenase [Chloroflexota bacterium]
MSRDLRFGVIGWPLGHTLSPAFQQAALDALGVPAVYRALPTTPDALESRLFEARRGAWRGLNVTIPHKLRVAELVDSRTAAAERLDAVNTVDARDGRLIGDNTDVEGFARALTEHGSFDPSGARAVLVGAGGAGRAVAWALADLGVAHLTLANRRRDRADALAAALGGQPLGVTSSGLDDPALERELRTAALLVNATSLGMAGGPDPLAAPLPLSWLHDELFVCDIVYRPAETPLLAHARSIGCRVLGGLEMLVLQGAASLERWLGRPAPVGTMMEAARHALAAPGA